MNNRVLNKLNNTCRNNSTIIISIMIVGFFMLFFMIRFGIAPFGIKTFVAGDAYHQILPLLSVLQDKLKSGESIFYYWNSGLGGDFLPSYYYYLASPINLFVVFVERNDISAFISITIAIKIILSAGFFGYYLSRRNGIIDNKPVYIAFSCAYALSSYICNYYFFSFWLDSIMVFPLIMLGYERLINEKRPGLYTLSLAYSLYCNYYLSYIICLFLVLWFLIDEYNSFKDFINKGLRFACFSILSAGISAIALIPSFIGLTKTISLTNNEGVSHQWYGNIFKIIREIFILTEPHKATFREDIAYIYCGTFVILLAFVYGFIKEIPLSNKIKNICLLIFLLISMNESILNFIWHGFHKQHSVPNRFAFLFIFLLLYISSECVDHIEKNEKSIIPGLILAMILPIISFVFVDFDSIVSSYEVIIISEILIVIYTVLISIYSMKSNIIGKTCNIILAVLMIVELLFNALLLFNSEINNNRDINLFVNHINEAFEINDDEFFRSDINDGILYNENAYHGMTGVGVFNSTVNSNVTAFMKMMGAHTGTNCVLNYQLSDILNDILDVKYIYTYKGDTCYDDINNYDEIYSDDIFNVYKNKSALSLGFAVDDSIKDFTYQDGLDFSKNINELSSCMLSGSLLIARVSPVYQLSYSGCEVALGDTDYLDIQYTETEGPKNITVTFNPPDEGDYYMDVREDNEDLIRLEINGELIREHIRMSNGFNRIGHVSPDDEVKIIISDNTGIAFQKNEKISEVKYLVYKADDDALKTFIDTLSKHQMEISDFSDNSFKAKISLDKNQVLFTSIPYDKGWHVYENGKELKTEMLAWTFLGLDLGEGEHELSFRFFPEGLYSGIIVTFISWFIFILLLYLYKKKNNLEEQ